VCHGDTPTNVGFCNIFDFGVYDVYVLEFGKFTRVLLTQERALLNDCFQFALIGVLWNIYDYMARRAVAGVEPIVIGTTLVDDGEVIGSASSYIVGHLIHYVVEINGAFFHVLVGFITLVSLYKYISIFNQ
jgi:hypothetical protein